MAEIVIYLLMVQKFINLKQKTLKFLHIHYVYDFSSDYNYISVSDIKDIHKTSI